MKTMVTAKIQAGTQTFYWRFNMTEVPKTNSDMLRVTAENLNEFLLQVSNHLDALETALAQAQARIAELEAQVGNDTTAQ